MIYEKVEQNLVSYLSSSLSSSFTNITPSKTNDDIELPILVVKCQNVKEHEDIEILKVAEVDIMLISQCLESETGSATHNKNADNIDKVLINKRINEFSNTVSGSVFIFQNELVDSKPDKDGNQLIHIFTLIQTLHEGYVPNATINYQT